MHIFAGFVDIPGAVADGDRAPNRGTAGAWEGLMFGSWEDDGEGARDAYVGAGAGATPGTTGWYDAGSAAKATGATEGCWEGALGTGAAVKGAAVGISDGMGRGASMGAAAGIYGRGLLETAGADDGC